MVSARALLVLAFACGGDSGTTTDARSSGSDDAPGDGPAPACGATGAATGVINGTITVAGTERTYILSVPAAYDASRTYPLVFAWHGRTGTASIARAYFGIEGAAAGNAIVVYPQGLPVSASPSDTGWELTSAGRDVALFDALHAKIAASHCVGTVFSMGHSFGGYMSNALACYRGGTDPGSVRAIASIAGGGPFGACSGDPVSAVIIHGSNDSIVDVSQGQASRDAWRTDAGCATTSMPATPSPCIACDGCAAGFDVRWCEHAATTDAGHGWPAFAAPAAWQLFTDSL